MESCAYRQAQLGLDGDACASVAPEPAPRGIAATSRRGLVMPHSLAYSSMPFLAPPAALVRMFIFPRVPFSMALKARTMRHPGRCP